MGFPKPGTGFSIGGIGFSIGGIGFSIGGLGNSKPATDFSKGGTGARRGGAVNAARGGRKKNGNYASPDAQLPHRTYIEMKKLSVFTGPLACGFPARTLVCFS